MRKRIGKTIVEWDINKNDANIRKHKISFESAAMVFSDANRITIYDVEYSLYEDRYITIGIVNKIITVVYTEKRKNIRIITARSATAEERKIYYGKNS